MNDIYSKLGANERAIVDKIKNQTLKNLLVNLIGLKIKLQWLGWLQYLMPTPIIMIIFLLALATYFIGLSYLTIVFLVIAIALTLRVLFDIITVKFKFRLPESRPKRNDNLDTFDLMNSRHSCRSYQIKKLEKADFSELMESINKHLEESRFSTEAIRFEYISTPIRVWPVVNATEFIVAIAPKKYDRLAIMDVGRTLQKVVIDATKMGLATCWIGPGADHESIRSHLRESFNPETDNIVCVCAVGYESKYTPLFIKIFSHKMRSRLSEESLFFSSHNMKKTIDVSESPYNLFGRTYESCKWAPSSYNGQTTRGIVVTQNDKVKRIDFVAITSSKYYAAVASGIWCANWEMGCNALGIKGEFKKLKENEIDLEKEQRHEAFSNYDISWVLSESNFD